MDARSNPVLKTIFSRKSVRHFTGGKVPSGTLETLILAGMAAPSAKDIRPWAFILVTENRTLEKLAAGLPFAKMLPQAGAAIVVCGDLIKASAGTHPEMWVQDCSAVTENILLAAEGLGLGAVWTACYPHRARSGHAARVLEVPDEIIPFSVIAIGYPTGEDVPKDKSDPGVVHREKW